MRNTIKIALVLFSFTSFGAEVDHYTNRHKVLKDSSALVNSLANKHLETALASLNNKTQCSYTNKETSKLYKELKKHFANHTKGKFVKELIHSKDKISHPLSIQDSIFNKWSFNNGLVTRLSLNSKRDLALLPLINYKSISIGVDKFEHMFGMGFIYFNRYNRNKRSLLSILKHGILREKTVLGGAVIATGVFSYADLSANFNGMRFWNHMLLQQDDILGAEYNRGPYVKCSGGKWVKEKNIDFSHYVDHTMDESLNCSKFATYKGLKKYSQAIKSLDNSYTCPMSQDKIEAARKRYNVSIKDAPPLHHWIINTDGNGKLFYSSEFKVRDQND